MLRRKRPKRIRVTRRRYRPLADACSPGNLSLVSVSQRKGAVHRPTLFSLKKSRELFHRESGLSNQRSEGSFGEFLMVGNGEASVRWVGVPENHVAAVLLIEFIANLAECLDRLAECLDRLAAGNYRQLHPPATSMTSSRMLGGTGSPCFFRLLR